METLGWLYTGDALSSRDPFSPGAATIQASRLSTGRLTEGCPGWLALTHHASNHQATTDQQTAAVPSLRSPQSAKLSNCGCQLGSKLPPRTRSGSSMGPTSLAGPSEHARCGRIDGAQRPTTHLQPPSALFSRCACRLSVYLISLVCKPPRQSAAAWLETGLGRLVVVHGAIEALDVAASAASTLLPGLTWR